MEVEGVAEHASLPFIYWLFGRYFQFTPFAAMVAGNIEEE